MKIQLSPDDMLMFVQAAQYEIQMRRTVMLMKDTSIAERKRLGDRIHKLRTWLQENNFDDMH